MDRNLIDELQTVSVSATFLQGSTEINVLKNEILDWVARHVSMSGTSHLQHKD